MFKLKKSNDVQPKELQVGDRIQFTNACEKMNKGPLAERYVKPGVAGTIKEITAAIDNLDAVEQHGDKAVIAYHNLMATGKLGALATRVAKIVPGLHGDLYTVAVDGVEIAQLPLFVKGERTMEKID